MIFTRPLLLMILAICGLSSFSMAEERAADPQNGGNEGVLREVWRTGVTSSLRDFEDLSGWSRAPDESEKLPSMAFGEETPGSAITRLSSWFEAPESGDYMFWISSQGSSKLILSLPDSMSAMEKGGLLFIKESIGWPQKGQWDLYADQRCGPWPLEKGRRYLLEIWHAGKPGLKRCELVWSRAPGTRARNWAGGTAAEPGRVGPDGLFRADAPEEAQAGGTSGNLLPENPVYDLFPPGRRTLAAPGDALLVELPGEPLIQRISIFQNIRPDSESREPGVAYRVVAINARGEAVAETLFRPEGESPGARFEWELPSLLPVARVVLVIAEGSTLRENGSAPLPHTVEAWGPEDGKSKMTPREAVSGAFLSAAREAPADLNGNGLADRWETAFGFGTLRKTPFSAAADYLAAGSDEDGDGLLNQMESLAGRDPFTPEQFGHRLTAEYWRGVRQSDIEGLVGSDAWFGKPDVRVVRWMERSSPLPQNHGLRLRGYVTAPETGDYTFWIAARNAGELRISEDRTKYLKHRVAWISPHEGAGHGISRMARNQWDQFPTQRSRPIPMKAGKTYFIEALAQQGDATAIGQLSLAWRGPDGSRRLLAGGALSTYLAEPEDADDDSLPDEWEKGFKLDPLDNGGKDRLRQGERGDFDRDGLTNLEEYQSGLDPSNPDSDGDGKKDGDEVHSLHTDPGSAEENRTQTIGAIRPDGFSGGTMAWSGTDQALTAGAHRGWTEWDFEVSEPGHYGFEFRLGLAGQVMASETMPLTLRVDGVAAAAEKVIFHPGLQTLWRVLGPRLEPGRHTLHLAVDNPMVARFLSIHSIALIRPEGPDFDRDGLPDWCLAVMNRGYSTTPPAVVSMVSPVCIEGTALENPESVEVNGSPARRLGSRHWYADAALLETPNVIEIRLPGRPPSQFPVTWGRTNVLADAEIRLRTGDSLLLAATNRKGEAVEASCRASDGTTFGIKSGLVKTFTEPGVVTVTGRGAGLTGTLTVHVAQSGLPERILTLANLSRAIGFEPGSLGEGTVLEGTPGLSAVREGDSATARLLPADWGELALTSRLFPGGPILAASQVDSVLIVDAVMQDATVGIFDGTPEGYYGLRAPIVVLGMPGDASLEIRMARAGVIFAGGGGGMVRITTQDLFEGLYWLELFYPKELTGGYCHYFTLRDRDGQVAGTR